MMESDDGWYGFRLRGIGWVEVAVAKVDGLPEIVGLRIDVRPMFVTEDDLYLFEMAHEEQRQWAIDNVPPRRGLGSRYYCRAASVAPAGRDARRSRGATGW